MSKKWSDLVEKSLEREDQIQKTYSGNLDGNYGYLALSNKKILFVHEKGFLHKTYTLILDIPYEQVGKVVSEDRYRLEITETG
ncbi:MAG: PH domain-containing protein, partial [Candidatus Bathyarchaeia archaeon]